MTTPTITDMFTGQQVQAPPASYPGEPTDAWIAGWDAGMQGDPKSPPTWLHLPTEYADWLDGYEAAERD